MKENGIEKLILSESLLKQEPMGLSLPPSELFPNLTDRSELHHGLMALSAFSGLHPISPINLWHIESHLGVCFVEDVN